LLNRELLRSYEVAKIIIICDYVNNIFITLQVVSLELKSKHYRIKLLVMRVLANLRFLELVINERNRMSLRVLNQLIKHVFCLAIRRINLHVKKSTLIVML